MSSKIIDIALNASWLSVTSRIFEASGISPKEQLHAYAEMGFSCGRRNGILIERIFGKDETMNRPAVQGAGCVVGEHVTLGADVRLGHHVIIEDGVVLGDDVYIDSNTIIRGGWS